MSAHTGPPDERNGPEAGRPESVKQDEALAGGSVASTVPVGGVAAVDLPRDTLQWAVERGADRALDEGRVAAVVGVDADDLLLVCTVGCCLDKPGAIVVVPDVIVAELVANNPVGDIGQPWRLRRADERECYVYTNGVPAGGVR